MVPEPKKSHHILTLRFSEVEMIMINRYAAMLIIRLPSFSFTEKDFTICPRVFCGCGTLHTNLKDIKLYVIRR